MTTTRTTETKATRGTTLGAFARESDESEDDGDDRDIARARERGNKEVRRQQEAIAAKARQGREAEAMQKAALTQDANAFEYDAVYDDMQNARGARVKALDDERVERKSRYIGDLIAKAEARKVENDISYERRLLKERLKDDHLYGDKEKFVTTAYREKLKEDAKWLAKEKITDKVEEEEDVARRGDMTAFYSNLMNRNSAVGGDMVKSTRRAAPEPESSSKASSGMGVERSLRFTSAIERERELTARARASGTSASVDEATPPIAPIPSDVTLVERKISVMKGANEPIAKQAPEPKADETARRNTEAAVSDARQRYLERKRKAAGGA